MDIERAVGTEFERNFAERGELGAAFAVWGRDGAVVEVCGGYRDRGKSIPWSCDTLALLWSATKGLEASCVLRALELASLGVDTPVVELWPEFGAQGKYRLTVAQLLNHQAGVPMLDEPVPSILDHAAVVAAIERQRPHWPPGEAHGYHARVFGFLCDELVRRLADVPLTQAWRDWFASPLGLDIWIGLPVELHGRAAEVRAPRALDADPAEAAFYAAYGKGGSLTRGAFTTPAGLSHFSAMNDPAVRSAPIPSLGASGDARSLARFYAALANGGELGGVRVLGSATLNLVQERAVQGTDRVLEIESAFSLGFMRDPLDGRGSKLRAKLGPGLRTFGHPGAGGVNSFADPDRGIGVAYVMNQMRSGILPNEKSLVLIEAAYGALEGDGNVG